MPSILLLLLAILTTTSSITRAEDGKKSYIVRMDHESKPSVFSSHKSWYESTLESPEHLIHVYESVFHGFSARLSSSQVQAIQSTPGFIHLFPDSRKQLHTTYSPSFLGLLSRRNTHDSYSPIVDGELWRRSWYGSDSIIGVFDTGVWPESSSFSDHKMSPVPTRWRGVCQTGPGFTSSSCNRKLIGARFFSQGYEAATGPLNSSEYRSPRDSDGHGSHTASTAAGRYVYRASLNGAANGTARGMAPRARVAAYKVCWQSGCFDSDILAAFDAAISDRVDVISLSVGGSAVPYFLDSIAIGSYASSVTHGIFVSCSAGNEGPSPGTVTNIAPWITTVGAGTMDRSFPARIELGDGRVYPGVSLYTGPGLPKTRKTFPLVIPHAFGSSNSSSSSTLCMTGSLDSSQVSGKIVFCERGTNPRVEKGFNVQKAGGIGMILANTDTDGEGLVADSHVLPAAMVGARTGNIIREYIIGSKNKNAGATIEFRGTVYGENDAPEVASFSSRGPNPETPEILKPDVIAPGVNILAAWSGDAGPTGLPDDKRRVRFNVISGTSMACPHVSGLAALLRAAHPTWSPAAVRSALMTSAYSWNRPGSPVPHVILDEATSNASTPLDYGAGHVDPEAALDPGLVYDMGVGDYEAFVCGLNYTSHARAIVTRSDFDCGRLEREGYPFRAGDMNYPSISVLLDPGMDETVVKLRSWVWRTVTNVGEPRSNYSSSVHLPDSGVKVEVHPRNLEFHSRYQALRYRVVVTCYRNASLDPGETQSYFGTLTWQSSDSRYYVRSRIVVTQQRSF